jgi:hypothetical protein
MLGEARQHVHEAIRIATGLHLGFCFGLGLRKANALLAKIDQRNASIQTQKEMLTYNQQVQPKGSYEIDSHHLSLSSVIESIHGTMAVSDTETSA